MAVMKYTQGSEEVGVSLNVNKLFAWTAMTTLQQRPFITARKRTSSKKMNSSLSNYQYSMAVIITTACILFALVSPGE